MEFATEFLKKLLNVSVLSTEYYNGMVPYKKS